MLIWNEGKSLFNNEWDQKGWASVDYWTQKSEAAGWDGISCYAAQPILSALLPALIRKLRLLRATVLTGKYFWSQQNASYLALVYETSLPTTDDQETLIDWGYHFDQRSTVVTGTGTYFAQQACTPPAKAKKKGAPHEHRRI